jgi:hypothetical protein
VLYITYAGTLAGMLLLLAIAYQPSLPLLMAGTKEQQARLVPKLASGETVMIYRWSHSQIYGGYAVSMGGYSQLGTQYVPTQVVSMNCQARFTIGTDDRVRDIAFQGNGCLQEHR